MQLAREMSTALSALGASAPRAVQSLFALEALPEEARDALAAHLTRCEVARACCVSRAWNAAFSAPHLWSVLDVTDALSFGRPDADAPFKADRRPLTRAVVQGACAKAGLGLRDVTLPWLPMQPNLVSSLLSHAQLQGLRRLAPHDTRPFGSIVALEAFLGRYPLLQELRCRLSWDIERDTPSEDEVASLERAVLRHTATRLEELYVTVNPGVLPYDPASGPEPRLAMAERLLREHANSRVTAARLRVGL